MKPSTRFQVPSYQVGASFVHLGLEPGTWNPGPGARNLKLIRNTKFDLMMRAGARTMRNPG